MNIAHSFRVVMGMVLCTLLTCVAAESSELHQSRGSRDERGAQSGVLADPATIKLYEGKWLTEDIVCTLNIYSIPAEGYATEIRFTKDGQTIKCANDEASSIAFSRLPAGSIVKLFNDGNCGTSRDWVQFTFKKYVPYTWAGGFEYSLDDYEYGEGDLVISKVYNKHDGDLDGKVSCMTVYIPPPQQQCRVGRSSPNVAMNRLSLYSRAFPSPHGMLDLSSEQGSRATGLLVALEQRPSDFVRMGHAPPGSSNH